MYSVTRANWFKDLLKSRLYAVPPERKENKQAQTKRITYTNIFASLQKAKMKKKTLNH